MVCVCACSGISEIWRMISIDAELLPPFHRATGGSLSLDVAKNIPIQKNINNIKIENGKIRIIEFEKQNIKQRRESQYREIQPVHKTDRVISDI